VATYSSHATNMIPHDTITKTATPTKSSGSSHIYKLLVESIIDKQSCSEKTYSVKRKKNIQLNIDQCFLKKTLTHSTINDSKLVDYINSTYMPDFEHIISIQKAAAGAVSSLPTLQQLGERDSNSRFCDRRHTMRG
jgi:hypothetical protein